MNACLDDDFKNTTHGVRRPGLYRSEGARPSDDGDNFIVAIVQKLKGNSSCPEDISRQ